MKALGHVFKYGDNVDTDVIIPARYLNSYDAQELASHAMADIDPEFVNKVQPGDIMLPTRTLDVVLPGNMHRYVLRQQVSVALLQRHLQEFSIAMRSTSDFRSLSVRRLQKQLKQVMK